MGNVDNTRSDWGYRHGNYLLLLVNTFDTLNIEYFVLRNYKGLPFENQSKDVDIVINPSKFDDACKVLIDISSNDRENFLYVRNYGISTCFFIQNIAENLVVEIDLLRGFSIKGFELYPFSVLYKNKLKYKGFDILPSYCEVTLLIFFKIIGWGKWKELYKSELEDAIANYPAQLNSFLNDAIGERLGNQLLKDIERQAYNNIVDKRKLYLFSYRFSVFCKRLLSTLTNLVRYNKSIIKNALSKSNFITVQGADGTGKTTFINGLIKDIDFYFNSDGGKSRVYHFRPTMLPNLGAMGEKAGVMKEDKDFTKPHRRKPAGKFSSFVRMCYYWMDYVIGVPIILRKNARFDNFTIFDRYIYDFIVDPYRSRINLPDKIRRVFAKMVIQPRIVFVLLADADTIYARKQELTREEINRQLGEFRKLAQTGKHFFIIDANKSPEEMVRQAMEIILNEFSEK